MKTKVYFVGVIIAAGVFYFAFVANVQGTPATMHSAAMALSYLVFSTLAFVLTTFGKKRSSKAALFFGSGIVLLFSFLPALRYLMAWFYLPRGVYDDATFRAWQDLYFYSPMIVSALCIYRGIVLWSKESAEEKPNQMPQPTGASAPVAER